MKGILVLGINRILNWCQIVSNGSRYTCRIKDIDGELFFKFKNVWHKVAEFAADPLDELVQEGGKVISRRFKGN